MKVPVRQVVLGRLFVWHRYMYRVVGHVPYGVIAIRFSKDNPKGEREFIGACAHVTTTQEHIVK